MPSSFLDPKALENYRTHEWEQRDGYFEVCKKCGLRGITHGAGVSFRQVKIAACITEAAPEPDSTAPSAETT